MEQRPNAFQRFFAIRGMGQVVTVGVGLVVLCAVFFFINENFLSDRNVGQLLRQIAPYLIVGIGQSFVLITGNIDLSIGSVLGMSCMMSATLMCNGVPLVLACLITMAACLVAGVINGALVALCKLPPFIATLGTMQIARGVCYIATKGYPISGLPESFNYLGQGYLLGVPVPIWCMVCVAVVFAVFLNMTTTGRRIFALGGNEEATRISGINTKKLKVLVYTLSSALAALAGMITASKLGVGQPTAGNGFEMDAIAAVVIGGASLSGGEGTVTGTVIGAAIIGVLRNALVLLQVDSYWQTLIIGCVIIAAVSVDQLRKGKR